MYIGLSFTHIGCVSMATINYSLYTLYRGILRIPQISSEKTAFKLILFVCHTLNSNYGRVRFFHKTNRKWCTSFSFDLSASTHLPPVRPRAGSAVQLAPGPTKTVRCLSKHLARSCCKGNVVKEKVCNWKHVASSLSPSNQLLNMQPVTFMD